MKRRHQHINQQIDAMRNNLAERIANHFAAEFPNLAYAAALGMSPAYFAKAIRITRAEAAKRQNTAI